MKEREAKLPPQGKPRLRETLERLVGFYRTKGDTAAAERWSRELEAPGGEKR